MKSYGCSLLFIIGYGSMTNLARRLRVSPGCSIVLLSPESRRDKMTADILLTHMLFCLLFATGHFLIYTSHNCTIEYIFTYYIHAYIEHIGESAGSFSFLLEIHCHRERKMRSSNHFTISRVAVRSRPLTSHRISDFFKVADISCEGRDLGMKETVVGRRKKRE